MGRKSKNVSQQCKYYEVDNFFDYLTSVYLLGNQSTYVRLYKEMNKKSRMDFVDFVLSEVEPIHWREMLKLII